MTYWWRIYRSGGSPDVQVNSKALVMTLHYYTYVCVLILYLCYVRASVGVCVYVFIFLYKNIDANCFIDWYGIQWHVLVVTGYAIVLNLILWHKYKHTNIKLFLYIPQLQLDFIFCFWLSIIRFGN